MSSSSRRWVALVTVALSLGALSARAQNPVGVPSAASAAASVSEPPPEPSESPLPPDPPERIAPVPKPAEPALTPPAEPVSREPANLDAGDDASAATGDAEPSDGAVTAIGEDALSAPDLGETTARKDAGVAAPAPPRAPPRVEKESEPQWFPFPLQPSGSSRDVWDIADRLFPAFSAGQGGSAWTTVAVIVLSIGLAYLVGRTRRRLALRGILPRALSGFQTTLRLLAVVFAIILFLRWMPSSFWPALPWIVLAAAAAAGWTARDYLPDMLAGLVLLVERRVRPGTWVSGNGFAGEVEGSGLRTTRLRDSHDRVIAVPNRTLLEGPLVSDADRWPVVEVVYRAPDNQTPTSVRRALEDAALISPWRAAAESPQVVREGTESHVWRVRVRLLEARFGAEFESALVDHVEELLAVGPG